MKKRMHSLLSLLLALALLLSLSACGEKEDQTSENPGESSGMVYTYESTRLDSELLEEGLRPVLFTDDGFYGLSYYGVPAQTSEAAEEPEEETEAGEEEKTEESGTEESAAAPAEADKDGLDEDSYEDLIYRCRILFVGFDGAVRELPAYQQLPFHEDPGDKTNFSSFSSVETLLQDPEGGLLVVESVYDYWFDGTLAEMRSNSPESYDKYRYLEEYYLRFLKEDGSEKSCVKLDIELQDSRLNFANCQFDEKGNLLVTGSGGVYCFSRDGSLRASFGEDYYMDGLVRLPDGTLTARTWGENGIQLYPLDAEKKTLGKPIDLPYDLSDPIPGDDTYDFYYINGMYLYGYSLETGEKVKILNWLDLDMRGDNLGASSLRFFPDGSLICVSNQYRNERVDTDLIRVYQVPAESVPQKETLTLAVIGGDWAYDQVIDFNRRHNDVRIQIVDYLDFLDPENGYYEDAVTKLVTEILSGSVPDLIGVNQLPYTQLAAKGLLEDLYPYLDRDSEMSREDFFPNVLKALEVNGGLYQIVPSFNVSTLMGASTVVGDKPGWTYQELQDALDSMPEGCSVLNQYTTRGDLLRTLLCTNMSRFVDWSSGEVSFNNQDFIQILEFTKLFPEEIPDDLEWEDERSRIAQGRQMLVSVELYSVDAMIWYDAQFGSNGCTYIGYPSNEGVGSYMNTYHGYAMSSRCRNKDAAWEFLRGFLTEDAQSQVWDGIPLSLEVYRARLKDAMTPNYERDENGQIKKDENGESIVIPLGEMWQEDGTRIQVYQMSQEQADKLWDAIITCDKLMDSNATIYDIVLEQAQAYYSGQKTAEEAARLIESKVAIYINEQR